VSQRDLFDLAQGQADRDLAIGRVEKAADPTWMSQAESAVRSMAAHCDEFTTDEVWAYLVRWSKLRPREPRAMAAVLRSVQRQGLITPTAKYRPSARTTCHARPIRIWRAA
jgi:hypothetical protein